jgi:hypothetical protein
MRWLLLDIGIVAVALVLLGLSALGLWRKAAAARSVGDELRERLKRLNGERAGLSARLDAADVTARLGRRSP